MGVLLLTIVLVFFFMLQPATRELCLDLIRQRCEDNDQMVKVGFSCLTLGQFTTRTTSLNGTVVATKGYSEYKK